MTEKQRDLVLLETPEHFGLKVSPPVLGKKFSALEQPLPGVRPRFVKVVEVASLNFEEVTDEVLQELQRESKNRPTA